MPATQEKLRYVKLPDGALMEWPRNVSAADFRAKAQTVLQSRIKARVDKMRGGAQEDQLKPAESGVLPWLNDVESDLRRGGRRTVVGKGLGFMQAQGDKGYTGLESEVPPAVADFMGSVPLGVTKFAQGVAETPQHPVRGPLKAASGALQAATIPMAFMGGPVANRAIEAIPSAEWAGKMFQSVAGDAGAVPVNLSRSGNEMLRVKELADAGAPMPQAIGKMLQRVTKPGGKLLDYVTARDFYSNITRLSADETARLNPIMKRQIGIVANALKQDIGDAAAQVGRAADYYSALRDYARAAQLKRAAIKIAQYVGVPVTVGALGAAAKMGWNLVSGKK